MGRSSVHLFYYFIGMGGRKRSLTSKRNSSIRNFAVFCASPQLKSSSKRTIQTSLIRYFQRAIPDRADQNIKFDSVKNGPVFIDREFKFDPKLFSNEIDSNRNDKKFIKVKVCLNRFLQFEF